MRLYENKKMILRLGLYFKTEYIVNIPNHSSNVKVERITLLGYSKIEKHPLFNNKDTHFINILGFNFSISIK